MKSDVLGAFSGSLMDIKDKLTHESSRICDESGEVHLDWISPVTVVGEIDAQVKRIREQYSDPSKWTKSQLEYQRQNIGDLLQLRGLANKVRLSGSPLGSSQSKIMNLADSLATTLVYPIMATEYLSEEKEEKLKAYRTVIAAALGHKDSKAELKQAI